VRDPDDDLEPVPLAPGAEETPAPETAPATGAGTPVAVRDRFLVGLAVVVGLALIALAVQLRAIAADTEQDAVCSKALVAVVSSNLRGGADERARIERELQACLGPDATLPGGQEG
jgi:hypothetical protein